MAPTSGVTEQAGAARFAGPGYWAIASLLADRGISDLASSDKNRPLPAAKVVAQQHELSHTALPPRRAGEGSAK